MGEVYRARDARLKRDVAIKVLAASLSNDPDRLRRFEQEAEAAGGLNHPNILAIYDVGTHEGSPFIVSELLEGETLRCRLDGGPLPLRTTLDFAMQIVQGLTAAHDKGIVHRDLKPENLFVTADSRVKILDFGLAKLTHPMTGMSDDESNAVTVANVTRPGVLLGTVGYMSPEQVHGAPADHRSDVFSLGTILYEMVAGRRAFAGRSPAETLSAILRDEPPELVGTSAHAPPALDRVIGRCLEKRPEDRFQSVRDLGFALADVAREFGVSQPSRARAHRSRTMAWVAGAALTTAALLGLILNRGYLLPRMPAGDAGSRISSLVVLPLANLSNDPEQEYFSDGMTEALIADLAQVGGLRVISRTSAMTYKSAHKQLPQIARELNVDAVVEGSIVRSGDRVRITAQLIDAKTDRHLWANTYERNLRDVLSLQSEVARAVAQEIKITLTPQEEARLAGARPVNPDAHEAYLRGQYFLGKGTQQTISKAIDYFNQAIEKDAADARPYVGLANAYTALRSNYLPPHDVMPKAKAAATKALQLDPTLAEAHVSMGGVLMFYEYDWPGAEKELKRAIDLSPNLAIAHDYHATYLAAIGRHDEAREEIRQAQELDPLSLMILGDAGWIYYLGRQYDRTIEVSRKAIDLEPNFWYPYTNLGLGYEKVGRFAEAVAALQKARQLDSNSSIYEMLAGAYAAWGKKDEATRVLAELTERANQHYVCPYEVATIYAGLNDKESTLQWLEKGYQERADCMPWVRSDAKLDGLRGDPRFDDLVRRLGFPALAIRPNTSGR